MWRIVTASLLVASLAASADELSSENLNAAKRQATQGKTIIPGQVPQETQRQVSKVMAGTKPGGFLQNNIANQSCRALGRTFVTPTSATFTPGSLAGLLFWYRDDSIVSSGGAVSQWTDKSASGLDLKQSDATKKPALDAAAVNGHDAVLADGSNDFLITTATLSLARPYHIFAVMKVAYDGTAYAFLMIGDGTSKLLAYSYTDGATNTFEWDTSSHALVASTPPTAGQWFLVEMLGKAGANATKLYINNGAADTTTFTADPTAGTTMSLFARVDGSNASATEFVEIVGVSQEVTGSDRTNLITYLQARYGL